jgi:peptidoglycan/xylan/chitin deacetylase (PgdA/CDA1 family)/GT2 family glycosyltransferase
VNGSREPELSVLIATHNRAEVLVECLRALAAQSVDPEAFEVVVADDGSSDGTAARIATLELPFELRCLELEKQGKSAALNRAIEAARGGACLFIDDDIVASPSLVADHLEAHRREPMTLGIGSLVQKPPERGDAYAEARAVAWNMRYEALIEWGADWADTYGGNFSAPRSALQAVGGFDTELRAIEDVEIGYRLQRHGCIPCYLPNANALHDDYKTGAKILADEERYGGFCAEFVERHPETRERLLGWIDQPTVRDVALRRVLLALRVPPRLLARLGPFVPTKGRRGLWYGFVSRYTFWRGVREGSTKDGWWQVAGGIPVLMYHAFSAGQEGDRYVTSAAAFERQLRLLKRLRYRFISLPELAAELRALRPLPRRTAVITIDDGYRDVYDVAFPILRRHRVPATVYLVTGRLGGKNDWGDSGSAVDGRPILERWQIEEMRAAGIRFGAHTRDHPRLAGVGAAELENQVAGSRADAEAELAEPVPDFAYPYGSLDEAATAAVGSAGFEAAATTVPRRARRGDDPLQIPRLEVMGSDSPRNFLRKLWIGGM